MTKTYHILAIGNSFSEDATRYLHQLAVASGVEAMVVNLYIGGCPLETHWRNIETGEEAYRYELNGVHTQRMAGIAAVLEEEPWDFIIAQLMDKPSHDIRELFHTGQRGFVTAVDGPLYSLGQGTLRDPGTPLICACCHGYVELSH